MSNVIPFRMLHRNIMVGHADQHRALYRLDTVSFPFLAQADKDQVLAELATFAYAIKADFSLYRVCRAYPSREYVQQAVHMVDERFADRDEWELFLTGHQKHLAGMASFIPEVYLAIELRGKHSLNREQIRNSFSNVRRKGLILERDLKALEVTEETTFRGAAERIALRRATTREIQWLLKRTASRGVAEPLIDENWQPRALKVIADGDREAYRPHKADLMRLVLPEPKPALTGVTVDSDEGETHQAMLTLGHLPDLADTEGPGNAAFLYTALEQAPFPVDVVQHVTRIDNRAAQRKVRKKVRDADAELQEQHEGGGGFSYLPEQDTRLARSLYDYLADPSSPPLLEVSTHFAVGATSAEKLNGRVDTLRTHFGTIALHRPLGSQRALYQDHLPRPDGGKVKDYSTVMTVEQFGSLIPHGVHHTGPSRGVFFARTVTGSNRPVKVDLTEATRRKRSPSWLLTGGLGAGKTVTLELLEIIAALHGSVVVDIDPKDDHRLELVPELDGMVTVLDLDGSKQFEGWLDPLTIQTANTSADSREDLALSYYLDLVPGGDVNWETHYTKAIRHALEQPDPCGQRVLDFLERAKDEDARKAGEALAVRGDTGLGRLAFADGSKRDLHLRTPVTTIRPGILDLPMVGQDRASYTRIERISVATFTLLTNFAMSLLGNDRSIHGVLGVDEGWHLLGNAAGRRFVSRINYFGRTNFISLILACQTLGVVDSDINDLIGERIVLGQESESQARLNLEVLGLDKDSRALISRLMRYRKGRGLRRDLDGNVAEIQVDPVYRHLLEHLDVNRERDDEVAARTAVR
jgi:hypothetical protein